MHCRMIIIFPRLSNLLDASSTHTHSCDKKNIFNSSQMHLGGRIAPRWEQLFSVQFSHSVVSDSLRPHGLPHARPPCPSPIPRVYSNSCPLSRWCHPTISSSVVPSPPAFHLSQHQGLFKWVSSLQQVAKVLEFQLQHQSFEWTHNNCCYTLYIFVQLINTLVWFPLAQKNSLAP